MKIENDIWFIRKSDLIEEDVNGETVILNPKNGDIYTLNRLGSCIWLLLESAQSVETVVDLILEALDTPEEKCKNDVTRFIEQMQERDLIDAVKIDDIAS